MLSSVMKSSGLIWLTLLRFVKLPRGLSIEFLAAETKLFVLLRSKIDFVDALNFFLVDNYTGFLASLVDVLYYEFFYLYESGDLFDLAVIIATLPLCCI